MASTSLHLRPLRSAPGLVQHLRFATDGGLSVRLCLRVSGVEVGVIELDAGQLVHASLPGVEGDDALPLLSRLPALEIEICPYEAREPSVDTSAAHAFVADLKAIDEWTEEQLIGVFTLDQGARNPGADTEPEPEPASADFDTDFAAGTRAYLRREYDRALLLFESCARLRPDDRRVRHNIERLRARRPR